MEQRGKAPEFQKEMRRSVILFAVFPVSVKGIEGVEGPAEVFVCLVDGEAQREDVNRMGKVIPVLHQQ